MNPAVTRWLEALRSGQYMQGKEKLHTKDSKGNEYFCCLGVACNISDLAIQKAITPYTGIKSDITVIRYISLNDARVSSLPEPVKNLFGLKTTSASFEQDYRTRAIFDCSGHVTSLAALNDNGATFEQIAQIIELRPQGLFVDEPSSN
jgi:hypothetical protein